MIESLDIQTMRIIAYYILLPYVSIGYIGTVVVGIYVSTKEFIRGIRVVLFSLLIGYALFIGMVGLYIGSGGAIFSVLGNLTIDSNHTLFFQSSILLLGYTTIITGLAFHGVRPYIRSKKIGITVTTSDLIGGNAQEIEKNTIETEKDEFLTNFNSVKIEPTKKKIELSLEDKFIKTLNEMDIRNVSNVHFQPKSGRGFTLKLDPISKLAVLTEQQQGKTTFLPNEMEYLYDYALDIFKKEGLIHPSHYKAISKYLHEWVEKGGNLTIRREENEAGIQGTNEEWIVQGKNKRTT